MLNSIPLWDYTTGFFYPFSCWSIHQGFQTGAIWIIAVNIFVYIFFVTYPFISLELIHSIRITGQKVSAYLVFWFVFFILNTSLKSIFFKKNYLINLFIWLWDLNSLTGTEPRLPEVEVRSPNHWTARELPVYI